MVQKLKEKIKAAARETGAAQVGVSDLARLADGPPSADPTYALASAQAVVSFSVALDNRTIQRFLAKQERDGYCRHLGAAYHQCWRVGELVRELLQASGYEAVNVWPNVNYRPSGNPFELTPDFSHRYGAVAAGIARFGRSGNVLVPRHGARILLSSVITSAPLAPDPMMEEELCDNCKLCTAVCQVGMMSATETVSVSLAGRHHVISRKGSNARCGICCGSWLGQHRYKQWSTWSPERLEIPESDKELESFFMSTLMQWRQSGDPRDRYTTQRLKDRELGLHGKPLEDFDDTCGFCQLVCSATREERKENYRTITNSGSVVRGRDGKLVIARTTSVSADNQSSLQL